ncbi:MAG: hypothetical protein ACXAEN_21865 [Candidatus Thorarchaeota archaeon]|jgi:hypothetical protein
MDSSRTRFIPEESEEEKFPPRWEIGEELVLKDVRFEVVSIHVSPAPPRLVLKPLGKVNPMTKLAEEFEKLNTLHGGLDALQKRMQEEVEDE